MIGRHPRDMQKAKLYRAERYAFGRFSAVPGRELTVPMVEKFVEKVWRSSWTQRHYPRAQTYYRPRIKDGRGTSTARGSLRYLSLPLWARTFPVILHEVAHALTYQTPAHGPHFAACFLALVRHFIGHPEAAALKAAFKAEHVRTRPKRKRKMTPEVLEVLRARGRALAAARQRPTPEATC